MKHKVVRVKDLLYKGCEDHHGCVICSQCVPIHCFTKEQFSNMECSGLQELTFDIPRGKAQYAKDMRRAAELLERHNEFKGA